MIKQFPKIGRSTIQLLIFGVAIAVLSACAADKAVRGQLPVIKRIIDLTINQDSNSLIFKIKGNQALTYAEIQQSIPPGVLFSFPDTALDIVGQTYLPPDNEIIHSIEVKEIHENQTTTARIFIALKREAVYSLTTDDAGVVITFAKIPIVSKETEPKAESKQKQAEPSVASKSLSGVQEVMLTWDTVAEATSYHVYWSDSPGVTKYNGEKASFTRPPGIIKGLKSGTTYYFVVTAVQEFTESDISEEISFTLAE